MSDMPSHMLFSPEKPAQEQVLFKHVHRSLPFPVVLDVQKHTSEYVPIVVQSP
jgi:hypothetical protein